MNSLRKKKKRRGECGEEGRGDEEQEIDSNMLPNVSMPIQKPVHFVREDIDGLGDGGGGEQGCKVGGGEVQEGKPPLPVKKHIDHRVVKTSNGGWRRPGRVS